MKYLFNFLKYNNAVPVILFVVLLGAGAAFAASPEFRQSVFPAAGVVSVPLAPKSVDASMLLGERLDNYDLALHIDSITEDAASYRVAYSYRTLEVVSEAWTEVRKAGNLNVPKKLLGNRDLGSYLSDQIGQVVDRELAYLREAQAAIREKSAPQEASEYASLVGKEIKGGKVSVAPGGSKDGFGGNSDQEAASAVVAAVHNDKTSTETLLSDKKIRDMIVQAVSDFLAVDTSMPDFGVKTTEPSEIDTPVPPTSNEDPLPLADVVAAGQAPEAAPEQAAAVNDDKAQ